METTLHRGPLSMALHVPHLSRLVQYLQRARGKIEQDPHRVHNLHFSRRDLLQAREDFERALRRGQSKLHRLAGLLSRTLFDGPWELKSVVVGEIEPSRERFTLAQTLPPDELFTRTDQDLGKQQLRRLRFADQFQRMQRARLVANFVEYVPLVRNAHGVHKVISRIKAEQEIWNKVADEIFDIDSLVRRDKQLVELSRYVKDIFGLKIIVADAASAVQVQAYLAARRWEAEELRALEVPVVYGKLDFLEVKDYLSGDGLKNSGWRALKSVVRWWDATFEIQIQPVHNHYRELERFSQESHESFRLRREKLREQLDERMPLFRFYRVLLRWLLQAQDTPAPSYPSVRLDLVA